MADFTRSRTIQADPDEVFEYLSKVENLPSYFNRMTEAHHTRGDEVSVTARLDPAQTGDENGSVQGEAWFSIDADARSLRWGAEGPHDYQGTLSVTPDGEGAALEVQLHTQHDSDQIGAGLDRTLDTIEQVLAQRPDLQA